MIINNFYLLIPEDVTLKCCMCYDLAFFIAPETMEPLCFNCMHNNTEARIKNRYG